MNAIEMLKAQHEQIEQLFGKVRKARGEQRRQYFLNVADMLAMHATIEERHFYPAANQEGAEDMVLGALQEHLGIKRVLADMLREDIEDDVFDAQFAELVEQVEDHVDQEEGLLFPKVTRMLDADQLEALAEEMSATMIELGDSDPRSDMWSPAGSPPSIQ